MLLVARTRNPLTFATFMRLGPWPNNPGDKKNEGGRREICIWTRSVRHDFLIDLKGTQHTVGLCIFLMKNETFFITIRPDVGVLGCCLQRLLLHFHIYKIIESGYCQINNARQTKKASERTANMATVTQDSYMYFFLTMCVCAETQINFVSVAPTVVAKAVVAQPWPYSHIAV